jgi:S-DNA-T family DNA segregation ATPase FtsK/SpoIIIE
MPAEAHRSTRRAEVTGFVAFAFGFMLLISLATFNPKDPAPFFKAGESGPARNFTGPAGAFLAELLIPQLFGVGALLLPLVLALVGWKLFWCRPIEAPYTKLIGLGAMLVSLTSLLTLTFGTVSFDGESVRAGGAVGELMSAVLSSEFNRTGAYIVLSTGLFVSLVLTTQFSFAAFLGGAQRIIGERVRSLRTAFTHFLETRRKEKLRREVIRKHQKDGTRETLPRVRRVKAGAASEDDAEDDDLDDLPLQALPATAPAARQKALPFAAALPDDDEDEDEAKEAPPQAPVLPRKKSERSASSPETRGSFTLPPTTLLNEVKATEEADTARLYEKGRILQAKCGEFGVLGNVKEIHPGPVVTTYEFKPDAGVKYSKIVGLADDLALALEAESIFVMREVMAEFEAPKLTV